MKPELIASIKYLAKHKYAWPGGYPLALLMKDSECLCADCTRENYKLIRRSIKDCDRQWEPECTFINWENSQLYCCNCYKQIESAYGEN